MKYSIKSSHLCRLLLAGTALTLAMPVAAQTASKPAAAEAEADIDAIVVTARKQNETALEVPIAISAFSAASIQDKLTTGISDIADFTPGFQMQQSFGRGFDRPIIRGASNIIQADGKVGIFLNGAPYLGDFSSLDLAAVEQIEVIKGPQSAVFGRGTLSGAINVILKRPSDRIEGKVSATLGSDQRREVSGFISLPVATGIGVQFGAKYYDVAGQFANTAVPGERLGDQNTVQYTAGVFLDVGDSVSANVRWLHQRDQDGMYAIALQPASANNCFLTTRPYFCGTVTPPTSFGINSNKLQFPGIYRNADRIIGDISWNILDTGYTLTFQGGYSDLEEVVGTDQTYDSREWFALGAVCSVGTALATLPNRLCTQSPYHTTDGTRRKTETYEMRLSSPSDKRLRGRIGAFASHDRKRALTEWLEASETGLDVLTDTVTIKNQAVFGGVDFDVTDTITAGAELRYQVDKVTNTTPSYLASSVFSAAYLAGLVRSTPAQTVGVAGEREATFKATLPRFTVNWRPTNDLSFYAQFAKGNAPGGFNPVAAPQTTYDEESLTNYEIGMKTTRWGFSYLNLALFWQDYRNQVLTNTYLTTAGSASYRANIGSTRIRGLEIDGAVPIIGRALRVQFNYTFLDAEIRSGIEADKALMALGRACKTGSSNNLDLPGCRDAASIAGNTPPLVSKHMGAIGLRSEIPLGDTIKLFSGVDAVYRSKFSDILNLVDTGNSTRLNAQAGVETDDGLRITVYARNLFDDKTPVGILRYVDGGTGVARAPTGDLSRAFAITPARKPEYGLTLTQTF